MIEMNKNGYWPSTPNTNLLYGLSEACDMLLAEGLDTVFARHQLWAAGVRAAVTAWGLPIQCADPAVYSPILTGVMTPVGVEVGQSQRPHVPHWPPRRQQRPDPDRHRGRLRNGPEALGRGAARQRCASHHGPFFKPLIDRRPLFFVCIPRVHF